MARTYYIKNRMLLEWYGDELEKEIAGITSAEEARAAARILRSVQRNTPIGSMKRSLRSQFIDASGKTMRMKTWQRRTPGTLLRSIVQYVSKFPGGGYIVMAGNYMAYYARIVEYGTKMRRQKSTGRFTGRAKAVKYLRKALNTEKRLFIARVRQSLSLLRGMQS